QCSAPARIALHLEPCQCDPEHVVSSFFCCTLTCDGLADGLTGPSEAATIRLLLIAPEHVKRPLEAACLAVSRAHFSGQMNWGMRCYRQQHSQWRAAGQRSPGRSTAPAEVTFGLRGRPLLQLQDFLPPRLRAV